MRIGFGSMTDERKSSLKGWALLAGPFLIYAIIFWVPVIVNGTDWSARQIAAENHLLESAPAIPGMILIHERDGRAKRVAVDQIESYQAEGSGSVIWLKARSWGLLLSQERLIIQEPVHILDTLVRTARGRE